MTGCGLQSSLFMVLYIDLGSQGLLAFNFALISLCDTEIYAT